MKAMSTTFEARLRARNQLTLPDEVVTALGFVQGDRFVVEVVPDDPDGVYLHRIRHSYAGALAGVYGDAAGYVETERQGWE